MAHIFDAMSDVEAPTSGSTDDDFIPSSCITITQIAQPPVIDWFIRPTLVRRCTMTKLTPRANTIFDDSQPPPSSPKFKQLYAQPREPAGHTSPAPSEARSNLVKRTTEFARRIHALEQQQSDLRHQLHEMQTQYDQMLQYAEEMNRSMSELVSYPQQYK